MSKKRHEPHEEHADESWLLPYSDLMTLLLALFIVLFGMSSLDAKKFETMAQSLTAAFNGGTGILDQSAANPSSQSMDMGKNKEQVTQPTKSKATSTSELQRQLAQREEEDLKKLKKQMDQYIQNNGLTTLLNTRLNQSQLMITISDNALFASGQAEVKPEARKLAKSISGMLQQFPGYDVIVSGHTDNVPISNSQFPSNFDLSAKRSLNFLRILLLNQQLDPTKFVSIGYGEYRPVAKNQDSQGRAKNRRVEISVLRKYQNGTQVISPTSSASNE
ncbi:flagellar motor protein MotB [Paenibacillus farraposensis]|uniref:Flagellar motor protein MotB n=2 Tax=Paenibacillus farraposensis TaxID=2807095 RepID=A0ABW4DFF5_9BACL|nr:flagellar motor protein MotB [Paenibacillus farraposensis]MCC3378064.1 flagellar motor protein MotB [Paenibacillus farraposensis]